MQRSWHGMLCRAQWSRVMRSLSEAFKRTTEFRFRVEENENLSSLRVLYEPGIFRLERPKPLFSDSDCMLQPSADLRMQNIRFPANPNLKRKLARINRPRVPWILDCFS